jgi:hypothetical protein
MYADRVGFRRVPIKERTAIQNPSIWSVYVEHIFFVVAFQHYCTEWAEHVTPFGINLNEAK